MFNLLLAPVILPLLLLTASCADDNKIEPEPAVTPDSTLPDCPDPAAPAPTPVPAPAPIPSQPIPDIGNERLRTLYAKMNEARRARGKAEVEVDVALECAASAHAEDIGSRRVCTHTGANGSSFDERVEACKGHVFGGGEIVACGFPRAEKAVEGWLRSQGHAAILLNDNVTKVGAAVVGNYWVAVFSE